MLTRYLLYISQVLKARWPVCNISSIHASGPTSMSDTYSILGRYSRRDAPVCNLRSIHAGGFHQHVYYHWRTSLDWLQVSANRTANFLYSAFMPVYPISMLSPLRNSSKLIADYSSHNSKHPHSEGRPHFLNSLVTGSPCRFFSDYLDLCCSVLSSFRFLGVLLYSRFVVSSFFAI